MRFCEKIRVAAFKPQNSNPAFLIGEWDDVKRTHSGFAEILAELGASFFTIGIDFVAVLRDEKRFLQYCSPTQNVPHTPVLRFVGVQLSRAGYRLQLNSATFIERDSRPFVRNDGGGAVHDRL